MIGLYPLATHPTTFDFACWAVIAKTHGVNHVRFVVDGKICKLKYSEQIGWKRFGNILIPICDLAGLTFSVGPAVEGREFPYLYGHLNKTYQRFGTIAKLVAGCKFAGSGYITITLRQSFRNRYRNCNIQAWEQFATVLMSKKKKVYFIADKEAQSIPIEDRMAMYAGADMNLGVETGPMVLCHLSDAPYITMNMCPPRPDNEPGYDMRKLLASSGFEIGGQLAFAKENQRLVWKPDTYENIMEAYEALEHS